MDKRSFVSTLSLFACILSFLVIGLGAFTRLVDAGLGCPDWPGCYGHLLVPSHQIGDSLTTHYPGTHFITYKAWAEMIHRYAVGTLSIFILLMISAVFIFNTLRKKGNVLLSLSLIFLLCYQISLGRLTVTWKLLPIIVTQHLLGGFLILSVLWTFYLYNHPKNQMKITINAHRSNLIAWTSIGLLVVFIQILLGAWTSTNYASLSCPDFPFCFNDHPDSPFYMKQAFNLFSPLGINYDGGVLADSVKQTIQMVHRIGALITTSYLFFFMIICLRQLKSISLLKYVYILMGLLCLQLCLGMSNVIFKLPIASAISHTWVAVLLVITMITFLYKLIFQTRSVI